MTKIDIKGCGAYGCAVNPVIKVENEKTDVVYKEPLDSDVSKLFTMDDNAKEAYFSELNEFKEINKLDKDHIFTVKLKGARFGIIQTKEYEESSLNKLFEKLEYYECFGPPEVHQIIMDYGGVEINHENVFTKYKITYNSFIKLFDQLLDGMLILQKGKKIHRDIKPPNVLFNGKKLSIIDFGLSTNFDTLYSLENRDIMNQMYLYFPPEYYVYGVIYNAIIKTEQDIENRLALLKCKDSDFIIQTIENLQKNIEHRFRYYIDMMSERNSEEFLTNYRKFFYTGLFNFMEKLKKDIQRNGDKYLDDILRPKSFVKNIVEKFDVYSLAYVILPFYKFLSKKKNKLTIKQKEFLSYIFNRCSNTNPYDRISIKELKYIIEIEKLNKIRTPSFSSRSASPSPFARLPSSKQNSSLSSKSSSISSKGSQGGSYDYTNEINFMDFMNIDHYAIKPPVKYKKYSKKLCKKSNQSNQSNQSF